MRFALLVNASPHAGQSQDTAYRFACAAVAGGHAVSRVFFYRDGVLAGSWLPALPADEVDLGARWRAFAELNGVELVVCVAAALRRGVLNAEEAERWERDGHNLAPGFELSGLGQLVESLIEADRVVEFG
ncbi:MAG: sulfurtransferase complex subunit TusD [Gammaproteobacteria bacterium]|nr:sulfurtransferase complex subunit TusD [Gammaproteobacteria bacterium]